MVTSKEVFTWAKAMDDVVQKPHFNKISFRVKNRIFVTVDKKDNTLVVKLADVDQSVFPKYNSSIIKPVPGTWGKQGWTLIDLKKFRKTICKDLIKLSYENVVK